MAVTGTGTQCMDEFVRRGGALTHEQQAWLLSSFCALNSAVLDPALIAQRHPPPGSTESFGTACEELGLTLSL